MISYENQTIVRLGRKIIGKIQHDPSKGYRYLPQGRVKFAGEFFPTLAELKRDIEG